MHSMVNVVAVRCVRRFTDIAASKNIRRGEHQRSRWKCRHLGNRRCLRRLLLLLLLLQLVVVVLLLLTQGDPVVHAVRQKARVVPR